MGGDWCLGFGPFVYREWVWRVDVDLCSSTLLGHPPESKLDAETYRRYRGWVTGAAQGGTGARFDWRVAAALADAHGITPLVAGGLAADDVSEFARAHADTAPTAALGDKVLGFDASSRLELAPGQKDAEKLKAYLDAVKRTH